MEEEYFIFESGGWEGKLGTLHIYVCGGALNEREIDLGDEWGAGCNKERLYEQNIKFWKLPPSRQLFSRPLFINLS